MSEDLRCAAAIRKRPAMYIGGTDERGVTNLISGLVANALDEFLAGRATRVEVRFRDDGSFEVRDDGGGMPFHERVGERPRAEVHWTTWHDPADDHAPHVHVTLAAIELLVVNALAARVRVTSWRAGRRWELEVGRGEVITPTRAVDDPEGRGTVVEVWPDPTVFDPPTPDVAQLRRELFHAAHLHPGLRVVVGDEAFHAPDGLRALAVLLGGEPDTAFAATARVAGFQVQVAAADARGSSPDGDSPVHVRTSWVNGVETLEGGQHLDGLRAALATLGLGPAIVLVHALGLEVRYAGPTRGRLDAPELTVPLRDALVEALAEHVGVHRSFGR